MLPWLPCSTFHIPQSWLNSWLSPSLRQRKQTNINNYGGLGEPPEDCLPPLWKLVWRLGQFESSSGASICSDSFVYYKLRYTWEMCSHNFMTTHSFLWITSSEVCFFFFPKKHYRLKSKCNLYLQVSFWAEIIGVSLRHCKSIRYFGENWNNTKKFKKQCILSCFVILGKLSRSWFHDNYNN